MSTEDIGDWRTESPTGGRDATTAAGGWREESVIEYPCRAAGKPAVLRITNRRLVILPAHDSDRELWSCRLQELAQIVRVDSGPTVSLILITQAAAIVGTPARYDSLFDTTGRFPCVNLESELASRIGALALDQLEAEGGLGEQVRNTRQDLPFAMAHDEQIVRHFGLSPGCALWVTSRRLVVHREPTIASGTGRAFPSIAAPEQTIMAKALPLALTWEIALADITGLEQQFLRTDGRSLRYIIPLTNSRMGDVECVPSAAPCSLFYQRGDRSAFCEFLTRRHRKGPLRELMGPPRPAAEGGDNGQWFWLFSIPVSGPEGEALWSDLGPLLARIYSGEPPDCTDRTSVSGTQRSVWAPLGEPVKEFEVPPGPVGFEPGRLVISRKGLTLRSHMATGSLSVQSLWHLFASQKPKLVLNHVLVAAPRKRNLKAAFRLLVAVPCALLISFLLMPHALILPSTALLSALYLLFVLRPKRQPGHESPAIGIASARRASAPLIGRSRARRNEEAEAGRSSALPRLHVGVPTAPALLLGEEEGRCIVGESNNLLDQVYEGKI